MSSNIELLAPAGDLNRGKIALSFKADTIYFGAKQYSLRARASNFDFKELHEMINYAHNNHKKAYLVTNIVCHNNMLDGFESFLKEVMTTPPDGFIVSDPSILRKIQKLVPNANIHISTQQSVTNSKAALFWKRNGASRIITAREVSHDELSLMIKIVHHELEIECFTHGAICISYSGRCMLSSNMCLRDANNGGCAQSCRWVYELIKDNKSLSKTFTMSAKDMCLINEVNENKKIGVSSLKIEGRMKSEHYIATVVNAYRHVIDNVNSEEYINDINKAANREVSVGWYKGSPTPNEMLYHEVPKEVNKLFAMVIDKKLHDTTYEVISRNYFSKDMTFEVLSRNLNHIEKIKLLDIKDSNGISIKIVNTPMLRYTITIDEKLDLDVDDMIRIVQ